MSLVRRASFAVGTFAGQHVLAELEGIDPRLLDDVEYLRTAVEKALNEAGATVCDMVARQFAPQGVTVVALLAESHASLHTYPEIGAAFLDVFTCGTKADPRLAMRLLAESLDASASRINSIQRGRPTPAGAGSDRTVLG